METLVLRKFIQKVLNEGSSEMADDQSSAALDLISKHVASSSRFSGKVYLAGGAVRDEIMGKSSHDLDIVVELEGGGIELANWLSKKLNTTHSPTIFERFGTAMLSLDGVEHKGIDLSGVEIEMVQTRSEKYDPDSRKPSTAFGSIEQDVMRRDLTINSLLKDLTTGEVLDLTGKGIQDIKDGTVRTPTDPNVTFDDDPLRILRAIRFTSRYDFHMTEEIKEAMINNAHRLKIISKERIKDELGKILTGPNPELGIQSLIDYDLLRFVLPTLVGKESQISTLTFSKDLIPNIAKLLSLTSNQAMSTSKQLKFSNKEAKQITTLANFRNQMISDSSNKNILKSSLPVFSSGAGDYILTVVDGLPVKNKIKALDEFLGVEPTLFFTGGDLLKNFKMKPGPQVGELIKLQQELWYDNPAISIEEVRKKIENYL